MVIMALDYGDRYVGVAISDNEGEIALRHSVIDSKNKNLLQEVNKVIDTERIEKIIIGMPKALTGDETLQSQKTKKFIEILRKNLGDSMMIEEADETYTSLEARRKILEEGGKMDEEHTEAARLILESYLKS